MGVFQREHAKPLCLAKQSAIIRYAPSQLTSSGKGPGCRPFCLMVRVHREGRGLGLGQRVQAKYPNQSEIQSTVHNIVEGQDLWIRLWELIWGAVHRAYSKKQSQTEVRSQETDPQGNPKPKSQYKLKTRVRNQEVCHNKTADYLANLGPQLVLNG